MPKDISYYGGHEKLLYRNYIYGSREELFKRDRSIRCRVEFEVVGE
jgi:hypothetical protein